MHVKQFQLGMESTQQALAPFIFMLQANCLLEIFVVMPLFSSNVLINLPSCEIALLLILDNIFHSIDQGMSTVLVSLELSAAFDTIDHSILLNRFQSSFDIHGTAF